MKKIFYFSILLAFSFSAIFACSKKIQVQGELTLTGNDPFTYLVLHDAQGNVYVIDDKDESSLLFAQNKRIEIDGMLRKEAKGIPNSLGTLKVKKFRLIE